MASKRQIQPLFVWLIISLFIWLCIISVCIVVCKKQTDAVQKLHKEYQHIEQAVAAIEHSIKHHQQYIDEHKALESTVTKLAAYSEHASSVDPGKALRDIASVVPLTVFLADLSITDHITIGGFADTSQAILHLLHNLVSLPYICNGKIVQLKSAAYKGSLLEFLIKLEIKPCKEMYGEY